MDFEQIQAMVAEQLGVDADKVTPDASFIEDLGADSLDLVEFIMALEEEFDIEIPDEDAAEMKTVADAIAYLEKATNK
ncbi:MAG: acyl carrier protein [Oscillospiraceae bacterium]|nr:acyl carrier protein [Oscillospiraceae bacterium]